MVYLFLLLSIGVYSEISGLLTPMAKPDGTVDFPSITDHTNILSQTVVNYETMTAQLESELHTAIADLKTTNTELQVTKSELQTTKLELETMKAQQKQCAANIASLEKELISNLTDIRQALSSYQTMPKGSNSSQNVALKSPKVAFMAYMKDAVDRSSTATPLIMDEVHYNAGNGYNSTTGMFTAPVSGTYMFSGQVELYDTVTLDEPVKILIKQSNYVILSGGYGKSIRGVTVPVSAITHMGQGEKVWMEATYIGRIYRDSEKPTYFSGALLYEG